MSPTLARHPRYTRQHATQTTHRSKLPTQAHHPRQHATHTSTPPTQAHHPPYPHQHIPSQARHPRHTRQNVTHASKPPTPPTLARIARHFSNSLLHGHLWTISKGTISLIRPENLYQIQWESKVIEERCKEFCY